MLRTYLFKKVVFLSALVGASLAHADFEYRVPIRGLAPGAGSMAPAVPSYVGDGVSKAGACATGAATGCATWDPVVQNLSSLSADKLTTLQANDSLAFNRSTVSKIAGKWYWEITVGNPATGAFQPSVIGVVSTSYTPGSFWGYNATSYWAAYASNSSNKRITCAYPGSFADNWPVTASAPYYDYGDVAGIALDLDAHIITLYKNGEPAFSGNPLCSNLSGAVSAVVSNGSGTSPSGYAANFGQFDFRYPVPAGFNAGLW